MDVLANTLAVTQGSMAILAVLLLSLGFTIGSGMIARYFWDMFTT